MEMIAKQKMLMEVMDDGLYLIFDDGSRWAVRVPNERQHYFFKLKGCI